MHEFFSNLSKALMACALVFAVIYGWGAWSKYREDKRYEEEKQSIGMNASIVGSVLARAYRSCRLIGVPEFSNCAQQSGLLPQDVIAKSLAQLGLDQLKEYEATCERHFSPQYCNGLLNRAFKFGLAQSN